MKKRRDEIFDALQKKKSELQALGVLELAIFGSSINSNEEADTTDIDFLVDFEKKTFDAYTDLKFLLESMFDCPIDLVLRDAIKPSLKKRILGEAVRVPGF